MVNTILDRAPERKTAIPAWYAQASSWLTYYEWQHLTTRAAARARHAEKDPAPDFLETLRSSSLKGPVKFTLTVMYDQADRDRRVSLSKAALGNMMGTSESTIKRHWRAAEAAGFLTKYDYPEAVKRPSDMWLWAGDAPSRDPRWDQYPHELMESASGPAPF